MRLIFPHHPARVTPGSRAVGQGRGHVSNKKAARAISHAFDLRRFAQCLASGAGFTLATIDVNRGGLMAFKEEGHQKTGVEIPASLRGGEKGDRHA